MRYVNVNTKPLFDYISKVFPDDEIPLTTLISNLCNSTTTCMAKKLGLLRDYICHLLDIDGDKCHNMLNVTRKFLLPFQKQIEYFCNDLHNDST